MNFNVQGNLAAVERSVSAVQIEGQPANAVTLSRSYPTTLEDLWGAATTLERIPLWFMPVSGDLKPGGRYQLEGNAGGTIMECERLSHFEVTWEFAGDVSWVKARFTGEAAGGARVTISHIAGLSEHWEVYGPGAVGVGWELGLLGLALHIEQPREPKPDEAEFAASQDGKALIIGSSERWADASVAAGTPADAARAAARRTTAFYTGEPEEGGQ